MTKYIAKPGFKYKFNSSMCEKCNGKCCRGESGYIWLNDNEIEKISKFIHISYDELKSNYFRRHYNGYSIKDIKINGEFYCIFFDIEMNGCSIYSVRPEQCKTYPFWDYYKSKVEDIISDCPGVESMNLNT